MTLPGLAEHAGQEGWSAHGKVGRLSIWQSR
jgi:hypothetical protein